MTEKMAANISAYKNGLKIKKVKTEIKTIKIIKK